MAVDLDLSLFFQPHDDAAQCLARAMLLASDLPREMLAIAEAMNGPGSPRRFATAMYFLRGQVQTQYSGHMLLEKVEKEEPFRTWLAGDLDRQAAFRSAKAQTDASWPLIKEARNTIGAHAEWSVGKTMVETARIVGRVHLADGVEEGQQEDEALQEGLAGLTMSVVFLRAYRSLDPSRATMDDLAVFTAAVKELRDSAGSLLVALRLITEIYAKNRTAVTEAIKQALGWK